MKKYLAALLLVPMMALAEGPVVDPTITPTWTITCVDPIERMDGTALLPGELANREFFVSQDVGAVKTWTLAGSNSTACRQVYDLIDVIDGQYYYTVTAIDSEGRHSDKAYDADPSTLVSLEVKRIQPPRPPSGLTGSAS